MRDTSKVIDALDLNETRSKLLAIIANLRGANKACEYDKIEYLGYPLSISNEFQLRNTGMTCVEALKEVSRIKEIAEKKIKIWLFIYPWHLVTHTKSFTVVIWLKNSVMI